MKNAHPLRTKLEWYALVWRVILSLIAIGMAWYFRNWLLGAGIFIFSQFANGFFAIAWLRLLLGKEGYSLMVVELAFEDQLPPD